MSTKKLTTAIRVGSFSIDPVAAVDNEAGSIYFNNADDVLKFRNSTTWKTILGAVSDDLNPSLGGDLDVNNKVIKSTSDEITLAPMNSVRRATNATPLNFVEDQYYHSIALMPSQTNAIISELNFDPAMIESIHLFYKMKDSNGEVRSGLMILANNGTTVDIGDGPSSETAPVNISFNASIQSIGATPANFTGQAAGMTTDVAISADFPGTAGNSVALIFDGIIDIDGAITVWNLANPGNTVTLDAGNGSQVPDNGESIVLSGGLDGVPTGTITYTSGAESAVLRVDVKRIKA